ncbi:MAG TPA: lasso RiPP family leader peptide-containing protein [Vicinamibacterales bacterium]|nr:lasso RiPP family leader peptide-containing protein [Vicinamibacterales bacterium]
MTRTPTTFEGNRPPKKPYERPRLEVYGNIREVTENLGRTSMTADNGHGANNKTS